MTVTLRLGTRAPIVHLHSAIRVGGTGLLPSSRGVQRDRVRELPTDGGRIFLRVAFQNVGAQNVGIYYRIMEHASGIGVLDKAVQVLRAVAAEPLLLADLCTATGLPRATAHRLVTGLHVHGLLARDADGRWRTGPLLTSLAATAPDPLVLAAARVLPGLRDRTGESVQVYRADGPDRVCIAVAEPRAGLRDTVPLGAVLPMTAGSAARVLVAWSATEPAMAGVAPAFDDQVLREVRRRGWAHSVAEREPGVASVSVPIRDRRGVVVAAVSVSGPVDRIGRRPPAEWATDLQQAAAALAAHL